MTPKQPCKISIQIIDISGQIVLEEKMDLSTGPVIKSIDLRNQPKGVYQIRIQTPDDIWTKRIAIQ